MIKEKSQAAVSKAQLWHGKRKGPGAGSTEVVGAIVQMPQKVYMADTTAARLWSRAKSPVISASTTSRPPVARHLGLHTVKTQHYPVVPHTQQALQQYANTSPQFGNSTISVGSHTQLSRLHSIASNPTLPLCHVPIRKSQHWSQG